MENISASNPNIIEASVWLYLTEKGRENKKRPFKYWMNNSELYFEVSYVHPTHVFDVPTLLTDAYTSFLQSVQVVAYDNEKKQNMPTRFPAESVFVNPIIDDINLITWTTTGWKIPFRCTICLPIDKVKYVQLFVNGWAVEFTLYAKASSKNKLDAGAPKLFSILGRMQRGFLGASESSTTHDFTNMAARNTFVAEDPEGNFSDPFSDISSPDYVPDDSYYPIGQFNPEHIDQLDPAAIDSPDFSHSTNDSFDTIISNYNPTAFEEEKQRAKEHAKAKRSSRFKKEVDKKSDVAAYTEQDRHRKRRLASKDEKEISSATTKKKSKPQPKLLTAKKEGNNFTQYIPTSVVTSGMQQVSLDPKVEATPQSMPTGAPTFNALHQYHDVVPSSVKYMGDLAGSVVTNEIILQPDVEADAFIGREKEQEGKGSVEDLNASEDEVVQPLRRPTDAEPESLAESPAEHQSLANSAKYEDLEGENEEDDYDEDDSSSASSDDEDDDDESEDERRKPVVFKLRPAKSVIERIAASTGMDKNAMDQVIKMELGNGKPKENIAFIDELHKDLKINDLPLMAYNHVLVFTDQYSVAAQRKVTIFVDKSNKMRVHKSPKIEVTHQNLEFNLYLKNFGKPLVSHEQVMCAMSVDIEVQDQTGFVAIVPEHVGLVIFVPFVFNKGLNEQVKNQQKK